MAKGKSTTQQNQETKQEILGEVLYWREEGIPDALKNVCIEKDIHWQKALFFINQIYWHSFGELDGFLVTENHQFIEFNIDTQPHLNMMVWRDTTEQQNFSAHNKGYGKGYGLLILEILHQLNQTNK